jgi:RNA polymerase sigma-70 factor (ECF subfamily)
MRQPTSEQRAWEFAMRHRKWLLKQAKSICRNASDAEDLTQDTIEKFVKASAKVKALPNERSCAAWLTRTLERLFIDYCRKSQVEVKGSKDPVLREETAVLPEPPERPAYDNLTDEQFDQAWEEALNPEYRATLELHAKGMPYRDIARTLGIKVGTVGKRLHDARKKLHAFFQKYLNSGKN